MSEHLSRAPLLGLLDRLKQSDTATAKDMLLGDEEVICAVTDMLEDDEKIYKLFLDDLLIAVGQTIRNQLNRVVRARLGQENRDLAERLLPGISKLNLPRTDTGQFIETFDNVGILAEHISEGKLCWDTFTHRLYFKQLPTWANWKKPPTPGPLGWTLFDEVYYTTIARIISKPYIMPKFRSMDVLRNCFREIAKTNYSFDYYQEIFNSLPAWDGVNRLDYWAETYLNAVYNNENELKLIRAYCRKFPISMFHRCYKYPCSVRGSLVLEGNQGIGKSRFVKVLGHPFASEMSGRKLDLHGDTANDIQGKMIVELSELDAMKYASDASAVKAFMTGVTDTYRKRYGIDAEDYHRRALLIATVNPGPTGYLSDTTGNSRFWPINCGDKKIDVEGFALVKDQILAEAKNAFLLDEKHYLNEAEERLHDIYVLGREVENPASEVVAQFVEENKSVIELCGMKIGSLHEYWRGRPPSDKNIATALQALGLVPFKVYVGKMQRRFWIFPGTEAMVKKNLRLENEGGNVVPFKKPDF